MLHFFCFLLVFPCVVCSFIVVVVVIFDFVLSFVEFHLFPLFSDVLGKQQPQIDSSELLL